MESPTYNTVVFKTPEGPAPKRRKLSDSDDGIRDFSYDLSNSPSPSSPIHSSETKHENHDHRSLNFFGIDKSDTHDGSVEISSHSSTPTNLTPTHILSPSHSPRLLPQSPSSPCESHNHNQHIHHARLQVLKPLSLPIEPSTRRVGIVQFSREQLPIIDSLPKNPHKCFTIQSLLDAFSLYNHVETIVPAMASAKDLAAFHCEEYLEALQATSTHSSSNPDVEDDQIEAMKDFYGLKDDCAPFPKLWQYSRLVAGGTILAARYLIECHRQTQSEIYSPRESKVATRNANPQSLIANDVLEDKYSLNKATQDDKTTETNSINANKPRPQTTNESSTASEKQQNTNNLAPVAINWMGGRHHAKRDEASGFCFVNDVVLGILQLLTHFERVLYIDVDIHHGDGVEESFRFSKQVLNVSFHLHDVGFFPGSGAIDEIGEGKAKFYTINVPFKEGISDEEYCKCFDGIIRDCNAVFQPDVIVLVCGADCLSGDPLGGFNLTLNGVEHCLKSLLGLNIPLLLLGGGGYHLPNVARMSAICTATALGIRLPDMIPPHNINYVDPRTYYLTEQRLPNRNTAEYLNMVRATVSGNLQHIIKDNPVISKKNSNTSDDCDTVN